MGRPISRSVRIALKLMLVTAQRRGEIMGAERKDFLLDGVNPYWLIPGNRTKNGITHLVPLTWLAKQLVQDALLTSERSRHLFPSSTRKDNAVRADAVTRALARLVRYHNRARPLDQHLPTISPHDLRRTAGTLMARAGVSKELRGHVLNHVTGAGTAQIDRRLQRPRLSSREARRVVEAGGHSDKDRREVPLRPVRARQLALLYHHRC